MKSLRPVSRRSFFFTSAALAGISGRALAATRKARQFSANEKINLGVIGVAGRGGENLRGVRGENIVALCDVDADRLAGAAKGFPQAALYADFRKLLDRTDLDAVVVSTPDHTHAVIAIAALQSGRHVYCEKPLTHTISEARRLAAVARRSGKITQTGNQIHSGANYRRVVELIQSDAIGDVTEVHHWVDGSYDRRPRPQPDPVPPQLNWDLWLGPVQYRDYSDQYAPFHWRRWWHFGGGTLADFCCHHIDLGVWALQLGLPHRVEAECPAPDPECAAPWLVAHYQFPTRKVSAWGKSGPRELPPVRMSWHHGGRRPLPFDAGRLPKWGAGTLFVGSKGMLLADYDKYRLLPESEFAGFQPPAPWIEPSPGQHEEWLRAIRGGPANLCPFSYGTVLTEIGHLGNVAHRAGCPIDWDAKRGVARNCPKADAFVQHDYRRGWTLG